MTAMTPPTTCNNSPTRAASTATASGAANSSTSWFCTRPWQFLAVTAWALAALLVLGFTAPAQAQTATRVFDVSTTTTTYHEMGDTGSGRINVLIRSTQTVNGNPRSVNFTVRAREGATLAAGNPQTFTPSGVEWMLVNGTHWHYNAVVRISHDRAYHADGTLVVDFSGDRFGAIEFAPGRASLTFMVVDDDTPTLSLSEPAETRITEGEGIAFTLSMTNARDAVITARQAVVVNVSVKSSSTDSSTNFDLPPNLTIPAGTAEQAFTLMTNDDELQEAPETVVLEFTTAITGATFADSGSATTERTVTIADDDIAFTLPGTTTVAEEDGRVDLLVRLSPAQSVATAVEYSTADGTATAGADYTTESDILNFAPGATVRTISVPILDDALDEPAETFMVTLSNPSHDIALDNRTAVVTITDNDDPPTLTMADVSQSEQLTELVFTVALSAASGQTVTVDYATQPGTAAANTNCPTCGSYNHVSGTLTFAPDVTEQRVTVVVRDDIEEAVDNVFSLVLTNPANAMFPTGTPNSGLAATGTLLELNLAVPPTMTVAEGAGNVTVVVTLSQAQANAVTVDYATTDGSATADGTTIGTAVAGADYTTMNGTLRFAPGVLTQTISVPILEDALDELPETFRITLSNSSNDIPLSTMTAVVTITDDDPEPTLTVADVSQSEQLAELVFTVRLSSISGQAVSVDYATEPGSAMADTHYLHRLGTLNFAPGVTERRVTVAVRSDMEADTDNSFTLVLSNPTNAMFPANTPATGLAATATLLELNLAVPPALTVAEDAGSVAVVVTLSQAQTDAVTVDYAMMDGSAPGMAVAGADYTSMTGTLQFAPGVLTQTISVPILADALDEPAETFRITLSNPSNNIPLSTATAVVTITDDDDPPTLTVADVSQSEQLTALVFTVRLSPISGQAVTVDYATQPGTALADTHYDHVSGMLNFAAGATEQRVTVAVRSDTEEDTDNAFTLVLTNPANAMFPANTPGSGLAATGTLLELNLTVPPTMTVAEDAGNVAVVVTLSQAQANAVTVDYATTDGSAGTTIGMAVAGADYTAMTGTLQFAPGVLTQTISVPILDDALDEPAETFRVTLSNPSNDIPLGTATAVVTITDDDDPPTLTVADVSGSELQGQLVFTVELSAASGQAVTVEYATQPGTALANTHYDHVSGTLNFAPGMTEQRITVTVRGDTEADTDNAFTLVLTNPANAMFPANTPASGLAATGTLLELIPLTLSVAGGVTELAEGATLQFTVTAASAPATAVMVPVTVTASTGFALGGTAPAMVEIAANARTGEFEVMVAENDLDQDNGSLSVALTDPDAAGADDVYELGTPGSLTLTITDNDDAPALTVTGPAEVRELDGEVEFTINLSARSGKVVTVNYATVDGTATAGSGPDDDYMAATGTLTIRDGTQATVTVALRPDQDSMAESFSFALSQPNNATLGTPSSAEVTILEGLDENDIQRLTEEVLPVVAAGISHQGMDAVNARVKASFGHNGTSQTNSLTLNGATPTQLLQGRLNQLLATRTGATAPAAGPLAGAGQLAGQNQNGAGARLGQVGSPFQQATTDWPAFGPQDVAFTFKPGAWGTNAGGSGNANGSASGSASELGGSAMQARGSDDRLSFSDVTFWGRGYRNELSVTDDISFDGDISGTVLGIDVLVTPNVLLGLSYHEATAEVDLGRHPRSHRQPPDRGEQHQPLLWLAAGRRQPCVGHH